MTRDELIAHFRTKETWSRASIIQELSGMQTRHAKYIPTKLQIGDVFFHAGLNHPVLILTDTMGVLTTTTDSPFNLCEINSRFMEGWITTTIVHVDMEKSKDKFICLHGNPKQVYLIKKKLKKQLEHFTKTL